MLSDNVEKVSRVELLTVFLDQLHSTYAKPRNKLRKIAEEEAET
jgi:hypothetical protein